MAGYVIGLPTGRCYALSEGCEARLPSQLRMKMSGAASLAVSAGDPRQLLSTPSLAYDLQRVAILFGAPSGCVGGNRLFKTALALLVAWVIGVLMVDRAGDLVHVLLLVGLGFLLLAFLRARDAAMRRDK